MANVEDSAASTSIPRSTARSRLPSAQAQRATLEQGSPPQQDWFDKILWPIVFSLLFLLCAWIVFVLYVVHDSHFHQPSETLRGDATMKTSGTTLCNPGCPSGFRVGVLVMPECSWDCIAYSRSILTVATGAAPGIAILLAYPAVRRVMRALQ